MRPTPLVELAFDGARLFAKLEYANPVGSIKDRAAYWILRRAAERGEIRSRSKTNRAARVRSAADSSSRPRAVSSAVSASVN